jgi:hypothetical protein
MLLALATLLPARAQYSSTVMSFQPLGYWQMNEPVSPKLDYALGTVTNYGSVGAVANGTYYHSSTLQEPGVLTADPCVKLDGASQYIDVPYAPALNPSGPFSVEFWANQTAVAAGAKSGVMSFDGNTGFLFYTDNNAPNWGFRVFYGTGRTYVVDTGPANEPDTWYHVVGVFDGTLVHIYVNSVENTAPQPIGGNGYVPNTTAPLRMGAGNPAGAASLFFPGWMDEVAVYPYALSPTQIAAHYTAATANPAGYAALIAGDQPTGYWRFNEAPLPPDPVPVTITVTNRGSWGAAANGTFSSGGMSSGVPGVPYPGFGTSNTACQFTGTSDSYIEIPAQSLVTDSWTLTCWAKRNGISEYWNMLFSHPNDLGQPVAGPSHPVTGVGFGDGGNPAGTRNDLRMYWAGADGNTGSYGAVPDPALYMPDQQWTFVAMVASPSNIVMYLNGQAATHTPTTPYGAHDFSTVASFIGKKQKYNGWDSGGEVNGFRGTIDELAIFDQALTPAEIRQIYVAAEVPPIILVQPQAPPPPIYEGMSLSLSVLADELSSTTPLAYQWTKNGVPLPGQTAAHLTVSSLVTSDTGDYAVVVANGFGSVTSSVVALTVLSGPPMIAQQPQSIQRFVGGTATFSVTAFGSLPASYQWSLDGVPIGGATSAAYTVTEVGAGDVGGYSVRVSNAYGNTNSANAALTLLTATQVAAAVTDLAPLAYWRLDETSGTVAYDYWGGRHGSLTAGAANNAEGPSPTSAPTPCLGFEAANKAYSLNNGWVSVPPLQLNTDTVTMIAWVNPVDVSGGHHGIVFSKSGQNAPDGCGLDWWNGGLLEYQWNSARRDNPESGLYVIAGQWNFVALVVEPHQGTIYLDDGNGGGLQSFANPAENGRAQFGGELRLGSDVQDNRNFMGLIDDVAIFDRALSADEIETIRKAGVNGLYAPAPVSFVSQPQSQTVFVGSDIALAPGVSGSQPLSYQWQKDGANIPGATRKTLSLPNAYYTDTGTYRLAVANSLGGKNSQNATLTVLPFPAFANLTNDLVVHLKFDGDYADVSGRANHGTAVGAPTLVPGKIGSHAVRVASEADITVDPKVVTSAHYVTLDTPADLQFGAEVDFTVAYWLKVPPGEKYTEFPVLCNTVNGTFNPGLYFGTDWNTRGGGFTWWLGGAQAGKVFESPADTINDGNWHHLVFSFDRAGDAVTYLDGVQVDARSIRGGGDVDVPGQAMNIGQDSTGTYPWFAEAGPQAEAVVDDLGIWRRALSPTEAQSIYLVGQTYGRTFDTYGPVMLTVQRSGAEVELIWQAGTLEAAAEVAGPYVPVPGAAAPYLKVLPSTAGKFYRVRL